MLETLSQPLQGYCFHCTRNTDWENFPVRCRVCGQKPFEQPTHKRQAGRRFADGLLAQLGEETA